MSLLIIGTMAYDAIETPFGKTDKIVGGSGTYVAYAATNYYRDVQMVSVVGDDFSTDVIEDLTQRGVDFEGLEIKANEKSFFWSGKYHNDMNTRDTVDTQLNVLADFNPVLPESFKNADYLMLGNLMPSLQKDVINQLAKRPKLIVLDTMNFWMDTAMEELKETLQLIDVLVINDSEARQLSEEYSLLKAAKAIRAMGPKYLIIKKGEHGALLFHEENIFSIPALLLEEVYDPTGAGDTFAGGFIGYIAQQDDTSFETMKKAVVVGSALASFVVEKFGVEQLTKISQKDIDKRVAQFSELTTFDK